MKIISKVKYPNGKREIFLLGKKIFKYEKTDSSLFRCPTCCDIYNYDQLKKQGTKFPHLLGIVISRAAKLGNNCIIYQNVTIGAKNVKDGDINKPDNYPIIGDNVTIYAGAVIVGPITVGNNAVIGANAVVFNDIPENAVVVGANKIIKTQYKS